MSAEAYRTFTGHPPRTVPCDRHERYDPDCGGCVEADSYCPHGSLGLYHPGGHVNMGCWRPCERTRPGPRSRPLPLEPDGQCWGCPADSDTIAGRSLRCFKEVGKSAAVVVLLP